MEIEKIWEKQSLAEKWLDENEDKWTRNEEDYIILQVDEETVPDFVKKYIANENETVDEIFETLTKYNKYVG